MEGLQLRNLSQPNNYEVRSPFRLKEILLKTPNAKSLINLLLLEIQEVKRYGGGEVVLVVEDIPTSKVITTHTRRILLLGSIKSAFLKNMITHHRYLSLTNNNPGTPAVNCVNYNLPNNLAQWGVLTGTGEVWHQAAVGYN